VMQDGRIVEEGDPKVLMKEEGHYNRFVRSQHSV
jgi:ABC-type multidrug transport system fused ATPase/permease subunit